MEKLILAQEVNNYIYKNIGLTYMAPDYETLTNMKEVAKNHEKICEKLIKMLGADN